MKKFLSVMLALLMVVSVMSLAGCKKGGNEEEAKPKTNAELFIGALEQLMTPAFCKQIVDTSVMEEANHFAFSIDELSVTAPEGAGDEVPTLPTMDIELFKTGDKSFVVNGDITLDEEILGGTFELVDFNKFYISMPEATDLYLTGAIDELLEEMVIVQGEGTKEDLNTIKAVIASVVETLSSSCDIFLSEDNLTKEKAEVEVFGEKVSLDKLTLSFNTDMIMDFVKNIIESLPDELKSEMEAEFEEEGKTLDEMMDELSEELLAELTFDGEIIFYLDGENVKRYEVSVKMESDEDVLETNGYFDIINTADTYKLEGVSTLKEYGNEISTSVDCEITLKDGKLTGEYSCIPEFKSEENTDDENASAGMNAILERLEVTAELDGEISEDKYDIDIECELSAGGMAFKLPVTLKGEIADDKITADLDVELNIMGAGFKLGVTALADKTDDVKAGEYDAENAVSMDDEDKLDEFVSDISEYAAGLESFAELFGSMGGTSEYPDEENPILFNIYNDDIDAYFFADGTGYQSVRYDLVSDSANGKYTVVDGAGNTVLVINLTGVETAEIDGFDFTYEMYDFGDGEVDYYFYSDEVATEVTLYPYIDEAWIDNPLAYTMSDSLLTVNGGAMEYTLDEDEGIIILDGEEYSFVSYDEY